MAEFPIPPPTTECQRLPKEQLIRQFQVLGDILNAGTLLIDVRRTDYDGGSIRGSLNMPAQSFPYNMSTLFRLCQGDGLSVISRVVFYCGTFGYSGLGMPEVYFNKCKALNKGASMHRIS
jgi:arsenical-resistance protein 2